MVDESCCCSTIPRATRRLVGEKNSSTDAFVFKDSITEEIVSTVNSCNTYIHKQQEVLDENGILRVRVQAQIATLHSRCEGRYYSYEEFAPGVTVFNLANDKVKSGYTSIKGRISDEPLAFLDGIKRLELDSMKQIAPLVDLFYKKFCQVPTDKALEKEFAALLVSLFKEKDATLEQALPKGSIHEKKDEQSKCWKKNKGYDHTDIKIQGSWTGKDLIIYKPQFSTTIAKVRPLDGNTDKFTVDIFGNVDPYLVISLIAAVAVMKSLNPLGYAGIGIKSLCGAGVGGVEKGTIGLEQLGLLLCTWMNAFISIHHFDKYFCRGSQHFLGFF